MTLSVGLLGSEGGAEGIYLTESKSHRLALKLAGNGQISGLLEEILLEIDGSVLVLGRVCNIKSRYLEHLTRALAVAAGNERCVSIDKAALIEELMNSVSGGRANAEGRGINIRSRAQMRYRSHIFERMALFLERIIGS